MLPSARNIAELSAAILGFTPLAPFKPIVSGIAKLLPSDNDKTRKQKERNWKVKHIPEWKAMCRALMDIPMKPERKAKALEGKIWSEWFEFYGEPPKEHWVEELHRNIYRAVVADMAVAGIDS
ncbi:MAG: hypothetical protein IH943_08635 [Acidobacteria bacterium]|nr:hypothetical protein [Acidobacteriota bacterium]